MNKKFVIYHDNCHDGITALWVTRQSEFWKDAEAYPGKYDIPPDFSRLRDSDVLIVDFSWSRELIERLYQEAATLSVLDHHKSAQEALKGLPYCTFDMERSGAGLAWDVLIGGERPRLVDYVEDRDLWRFDLPYSREVHAACGSYPLELNVRDALMRKEIPELVAEGTHILRYHNLLVEAAAKHALRETIGGFDVPSLACPNIQLASDIGHILAVGEPFAAVWVQRPNGTKYYGLRSTEGGEDVSKIARQYGGGGHRNAAGFVK